MSQGIQEVYKEPKKQQKRNPQPRNQDPQLGPNQSTKSTRGGTQEHEYKRASPKIVQKTQFNSMNSSFLVLECSSIPLSPHHPEKTKRSSIPHLLYTANAHSVASSDGFLHIYIYIFCCSGNPMQLLNSQGHQIAALGKVMLLMFC